MNPTTITTDIHLWFHARASDLRRRLAELTKPRWARQTHDQPATETNR